jgi:hypothetical protein
LDLLLKEVHPPVNQPAPEAEVAVPHQVQKREAEEITKNSVLVINPNYLSRLL